MMQTYHVHLMGTPAEFKAANIDNLRKNLIEKYPMEIIDLGMKITTKTGRMIGILMATEKNGHVYYLWKKPTENAVGWDLAAINPKNGKLYPTIDPRVNGRRS